MPLLGGDTFSIRTAPDPEIQTSAGVLRLFAHLTTLLSVLVTLAASAMVSQVYTGNFAKNVIFRQAKLAFFGAIWYKNKRLLNHPVLCLSKKARTRCPITCSESILLVPHLVVHKLNFYKVSKNLQDLRYFLFPAQFQNFTKNFSVDASKYEFTAFKIEFFHCLKLSLVSIRIGSNYLRQKCLEIRQNLKIESRKIHLLEL